MVAVLADGSMPHDLCTYVLRTGWMLGTMTQLSVSRCQMVPRGIATPTW